MPSHGLGITHDASCPAPNAIVKPNSPFGPPSVDASFGHYNGRTHAEPFGNPGEQAGGWQIGVNDFGADILYQPPQPPHNGHVQLSVFSSNENRYFCFVEPSPQIQLVVNANDAHIMAAPPKALTQRHDLLFGTT
jgi:hypothetical protein